MIPVSKCGLSEAVQSELVKVFSQIPGIHRVILFGSRAKGSFKPGSDIDLAIEAPDLSTRDLLQIKTIIDDLMLPFKVDVLLRHQLEDASLEDHIQRVGLVFYHK